MKYLSLLLTVSLLWGCSSLEDKDPTRNWSAARFYRAASSALADKNYEIAIEYYETLETRFPFGPYAQQAQLEVAYAYYKYEEPDLAIASTERFIKTFPRHENVAYAYYLKGLVNFNRGLSFIDRYLQQDVSERDPGAARQAFYDFKTLIEKHPKSDYAEDARKRMLYLRNNLARYELHAADFYIRRKAYVAAANRASYIIENFARAPAVADAMAALSRAYMLLEIPDLAEDSLRALKHNFPEHGQIAELEAQFAEINLQ